MNSLIFLNTVLPLVVHTSHPLPRSPSTAEKLSELGALPSPLGLNEGLKKIPVIKKNTFLKLEHSKPQISSQCNFLIHSLFSPIKNKNTIFFLQEKILIFFTFNSPFLSEKRMK